VKKTNKLEVKKVTLRSLDEPTLDAVAGGFPTRACTLMNTCLCENTTPYTWVTTCVKR
jgi:hypothetical protein